MQPALCVPRMLPAGVWVRAAKQAAAINPANRPDTASAAYIPAFHLEPEHIAALTSAYWGAAGIHLGVRFLDNLRTGFKEAILREMNRWSDYANVSFRESKANAELRVATEPGQGHYSYVGTDCLQVPDPVPTMNFDGFTEDTDAGELARVVGHEAGHALGFIHEHLRRALVSRIDVNAAVTYFARTQGWSRAMTIRQVLTPVEESALLHPPAADEDSIMTYQLPGSIMRDGQDLRGGKAITAADGTYAGLIYPKATDSGLGLRITVEEVLQPGSYTLVRDEAASLKK